MSNSEICVKVLNDEKLSDEEKIRIIQSLKESRPDNSIEGSFSVEDEILNEGI